MNIVYIVVLNVCYLIVYTVCNILGIIKNEKTSKLWKTYWSH